MQKVLLSLVLVLVLVGVAHSAERVLLVPSHSGNSLPALLSFPVISGATTTATTASTHYDLGTVLSTWSCAVSWSTVSAPTNVSARLEGSADNANWYWLWGGTISSSGTTSFNTGKPAQFIRGIYDIRTNGSTTTAVTMRCIGAP